MPSSPTKRSQTYLPFQGFYESIHGGAIESALVYYEEENVPTGCWERYSKAYLEEFAEYFEMPSFSFVKLISPKFYNYETDVIEVSIPTREMRDIYTACRKLEGWAEHVKKKCSDRPGFISFFPSDCTDVAWAFPNLQKAQLELILGFYIRHIKAVEDEDWEQHIADTLYETQESWFYG